MNKSAALVYPYFLTGAESSLLFQPLGIASLSSQLKAAGIEARQYDCTFSDPVTVTDAIAAQSPAIVGIYIMISMSRNAMTLLEALKKRLPGALFITGGPLPTLYPEKFSRLFDAVFCGEADLTLGDFCLDYFSGGGLEYFRDSMRLDKYPGIYSRAGGKTTAVKPVNHPDKVLDGLPLPDRRGVDYKKYQELWHGEAGFSPATIMLTRGCPYNCDFCSKPVFGNILRKRSVGNVMREVRDIASMGYDRLWIGDDSFTLDVDYLKEFCEAMIRENSVMTWTCLSRVTGIDGNIAGMMKKAGCVKVYLGLESGSDETLRLMKKAASVGEGEAAVRMFGGAGIKTAGFFMVGYPGETRENMEKTFGLALGLPLDEISFTVPFPLPGSELFKRIKGLVVEDDWDVENEVKFVYKSEFDAEYIKERISGTMAAFRKKKLVSA